MVSSGKREPPFHHTVYSSVLSEVFSGVYITFSNVFFKKKRLFENKIKEKGNYGSLVRGTWKSFPERVTLRLVCEKQVGVGQASGLAGPPGGGTQCNDMHCHKWVTVKMRGGGGGVDREARTGWN